MLSVRLEKALLGLLITVVIITLCVFIGLSFFDYPSADDFCYAAVARERGFLDGQAFWYAHWSGRYTLNVIYTAWMLAGNLYTLYSIPPIIFLLATWLGFSFLIGQVCKQRLSKPLVFLMGGICTLIFIAGTPDVAQTFYWMGGSITYQLPNVLLLFLLGLFIQRETTENSSARDFLLAALIVILIIGANEVSLALTLSILCGGTLQSFWRRHTTRIFWSTLLIIAVMATTVSVLAPGNVERYASLTTDGQLRLTPWLAATLYLPWVILRVFYWLSNLSLWASAVIVFVTIQHTTRHWFYENGQFRRGLLAIPVLWIGLICALHAIGFVVNRYPLPERAESVIWLLFLIGWYPSFVITAYFICGERVYARDRRWMKGATALLIISLVGSSNVFEAYKDVYRGYRYQQEMQQRMSTIDAAKARSEQQIVVNSLSRPPRTLFATDLTTHPDDLRNHCMRMYYNVESITLGPSQPKK